MTHPPSPVDAPALAPAGSPKDRFADLPRRLTGGAYGAAALFGLALLTEPLRPAAAAWQPPSLVASVAGLALSLGVGHLAGSRSWTRAGLADLALAFEIGIGIVLWAGELAIPFAETTHTPGIPTVAGWLLFFPVLVPLPFRSALLASIVVVLSGPLILLAYVLGGQPAPSPGHATLWFSAATLAAGAAVYTSAVLQRAFTGILQARRRSAYELIQPIGGGAMGEVWMARHARLARYAAVKRIRPDALADRSPHAIEALTRRFQVEARITAGLRSIHTVELYDHGIAEDGALYFAMELLDGIDLQDLVERFGPQPPARVVHVIRSACDSLAEAHEQGLVHHDIKPSNLMVCRMGVQRDVLKVLDFGTARITRPSAGETTPTDSRVGPFIGTPAYAAPETHHGEADARSDLYALGCVAWWLYAGTRVFDRATIEDEMRAHRDDPVPPLDQVLSTPPHPGLAAIIHRLLAKDPAARFPSAASLADALDALDLAAWRARDAEAWWTAAGPGIPTRRTHLPSQNTASRTWDPSMAADPSPDAADRV